MFKWLRRNASRRVGVIESVPLDGKRNIVLVRRDDTEQLVLVGGRTDVVIEPIVAVEEILKATGRRGVDCAIDCAAGEHTTSQAIQVARNAGRVALTGIHSTAFVALDASSMRRKELTIFNVRRSNHETQEALDLLQAHPEWFAPLLTHTRQIERIDEAFAIASQYRDGVGKMIVKP